MCGRYSDKYSWRELHDLYRLTMGGDFSDNVWEGRVNIAPTTLVPVIRSLDGVRRIDLMRWGLIPAWSKEIGKFATFNARSDGVDSKPSYRGAWKAGRRCIIPASSFFEWRKPDKQPFAIGMGNQGPMAFAGLWEEWKPKDAPAVLSCTIITTDANSLMAPIHDRMPAIIGDENVDAWLGETPASNDQLKAVLAPFPPERMKAWQVSKAVGNVKNQDPSLVQPF